MEENEILDIDEQMHEYQEWEKENYEKMVETYQYNLDYWD